MIRSAVLVILAVVALALPNTAPAAVIQELVVVQGLDPENLDPHNTIQAQLNITTQVTEPLIDIDYETGKLVPVLATSWRILSAKVWQFKLRQGIRFTNGEELTSETIRWNIDRINDPAGRVTVRIYAGVIERVQPVDKYTVNIETRDPFPLLPLYMTKVPIAPIGWGRQPEPRKLIGSGPFMFREWVRDERVVLTANPNYWGGRPRTERLTFVPLPDPAARAAALRSGKADLVTLLPVADALALGPSSAAGVKVVSVPSLRVMYIALDSIHPGVPTQNLKLRQALNHAVDKDAIVRSVMRGFAVKLEGQPITPQYSGFNPRVKAYPYDPQRARQLLQESGAQNTTLTLYAPVGRYAMDKEIAEAVAAQLQAAGFRIDLRVQEWGVFISGWNAKRTTPMALIGIATVPDGATILAVQTTPHPAGWFSNREFDQLIESAQWEIDERKRIPILHKAVEVLNEQAAVLFLHQQVDIYGLSNRILGWKPRPDEKLDLWGVSLR